MPWEVVSAMHHVQIKSILKIEHGAVGKISMTDIATTLTRVIDFTARYVYNIQTNREHLRLIFKLIKLIKYGKSGCATLNGSQEVGRSVP